MSLYQPSPTPLPPLPSLPPHSYAIFCCAWRIHLACGFLRSDGYISFGGGGLVNRYLLLATAGSARADAEVSTGTNSPTWGAYRGAHPPSSDSHATARTGRHPHTHTHTASACPAGVPVYVCLVQWLVSHCAAVTIAPPSLAHHPLPCRNALSDPG